MRRSLIRLMAGFTFSGVFLLLTSLLFDNPKGLHIAAVGIVLVLFLHRSHA